MRMRASRAAALLAAAAVTAGAFSSCGAAEDSKEKVTVALWNNQLLESYAPWLQAQFPEVEFDFCVSNNSTGYFVYQAQNDNLPDIMTVRRFSLRDVEEIKDSLLDLSDTELASTFYQSYLRNYTYDDGTVNWLPACAEIADLVVNKTLFEENNIPLPTDYESFVYACEEFEKLGIKGFQADFGSDYTCLEVLQGLAVSSLSSAEGIQWRNDYESANTDVLNEDVWLPAFEKMLEFIDDAGVSSDYADFDKIYEDFQNGKLAMFRGIGADIEDQKGKYELTMLPYFGDTEDDNRYLTYPAFQAAASGKAAENPEREALILDIMTAMFSEEGLNHISSGKNMMAYNKDVSLTLSDELSNLREYIDSNKVYVRLASSDMFSVSKSVVQKMIEGEITDAKTALDTFNAELTADDDAAAEDTVLTVGKTLSREFDEESGSAAASALCNTVRESLGVDCVLSGSTIAAGDISEGSYTTAQIPYIANWNTGKLLKMNLTAEELEGLVQWMLDVEGIRDSVINDSTLPVSSGFEMEITESDGKYTLDKITFDGKEAESGKTYSVVLRITYVANAADVEAAGFAYESVDDSVMSIFKTCMESGTDWLAEPSDYISLNRS